MLVPDVGPAARSSAPRRSDPGAVPGWLVAVALLAAATLTGLTAVALGGAGDGGVGRGLRLVVSRFWPVLEPWLRAAGL